MWCDLRADAVLRVAVQPDTARLFRLRGCLHPSAERPDGDVLSIPGREWVAITGDVWFGYDGSGDTSRYFAGRMDNVQLSSRWAELEGSVPSGCVED